MSHPLLILTSTKHLNMQFATRNLRDCNFYISNLDMRGAAFSLAYNQAKESKSNEEFCVHIGSMLCDIFTDLRSSIEAALNEIGVRPHLVSLTSLASLIEANILPMGLPTILVYFACCILILFKKFTDETHYKAFMSSSISELREIAACDSDAELNIPPFDFKRANAITTLLGGCSYLRADAIRFLVSASNQSDTRIGRVCQYLCNKLAWCDMRYFTLMNDLLVKVKSKVLSDPSVSEEARNLTEACAVVSSHPYPQFVRYLSSNEELLKVVPSRFPTLIAVALELEKENNSGLVVTRLESVSTAGANQSTVQDLVKLHQTTTVQDSVKLHHKPQERIQSSFSPFDPPKFSFCN